MYLRDIEFAFASRFLGCWYIARGPAGDPRDNESICGFC